MTQRRKCHSLNSTSLKDRGEIPSKRKSAALEANREADRSSRATVIDIRTGQSRLRARGVIRATNTTIEIFSLNMRADPSHRATPPAPGGNCKWRCNADLIRAVKEADRQRAVCIEKQLGCCEAGKIGPEEIADSVRRRPSAA